MVCVSSTNRLIFHILLWFVVLVFCLPAVAQNQDLQPANPTIQPNPDTGRIVLQPSQRLEILRQNTDRVITKAAQGPIDWPAAYNQLTNDVRPFQRSSSSNIPTTSTAVIRAFQADERTLKNMGAEMQRLSRTMRTINRPKLPILLPPDPPMLDVYKKMAPNFPNARSLPGKLAFFHGLDDHYASTFEMDGVDIMINGSRIEFSSDARKLPRDPSRLMSDGTRMMPIERDDVGVTLRFNRFGAAYIIEIACANPQVDVRCRQDAFVNDVYKKLLLFGGQP